MSSHNGFEAGLDELLKEYRKRRASAGERQRQIREISAAGVAPRQAVKVTVGAQGDLTGIEFPTGAYKRMAPSELAEAVMGAAREAQAKALESYQELMTPMMPNGLNFLDLIQGKADLASVLPPEPPMPDIVREYLQNGRMAARTLGDGRG